MNRRTAVRFFLVLIILSTAIYAAVYLLPYMLRIYRPPKRKFKIIKHFGFSEENDLAEWQEKVLRRHVKYSIESVNGESYVYALSNRSCSGLYYKITLDLSTRPVLAWKWQIKTFPDKKTPDNLLDKSQDDYAARMYVIFPALFFSRSRVIEYVWANDAEIGTISSSPYTDNIKIMVVESGMRDKKGWVQEERNIYEDYVRLFNAKPKYKMGAIAFMCDSDSTKSIAEAYFDDIKLFIPE